MCYPSGKTFSYLLMWELIVSPGVTATKGPPGRGRDQGEGGCRLSTDLTASATEPQLTISSIVPGDFL